MRADDLAVGTMVGAGQHFSYSGRIVDSFTPQQLLQRKRKLGNQHDQLSELHIAFAILDVLAGAS